MRFRVLDRQINHIKINTMNKREFLKTTAILGAGTIITPTMASSNLTSATRQGATASLVALNAEGNFEQPALGYAFDALEPHIDARTMEVHYGKHHAGYTKKFNAALEHADLHSTDIKKLFASVSSHGSGVRNNGGAISTTTCTGNSCLPMGVVNLQESLQRRFLRISDPFRSSRSNFQPHRPVTLVQAGDGYSLMKKGSCR